MEPVQPGTSATLSEVPVFSSLFGSSANAETASGLTAPGVIMGPPGDVRLEITPKNAQVYVDGYYVGVADDFNGRSQRLALPSGPHHVVLHADGYESLEADLYVQPRHTIDYRGNLMRSAS